VLLILFTIAVCVCFYSASS